MGAGLLTPLFLAGLAAVAIPCSCISCAGRSGPRFRSRL